MDALYQPTVTLQFYKHVFAYLSSHGVLYRNKGDFNGMGGFQAFWADLYSEAGLVRGDLGREPMKAVVDHNAEWKIKKYGNYRPFEVYDDCVDLLVHYVLKLMHGRATEVSFCCLVFINLVIILMIMFCISLLHTQEIRFI